MSMSHFMYPSSRFTERVGTFIKAYTREYTVFGRLYGWDDSVIYILVGDRVIWIDQREVVNIQ